MILRGTTEQLEAKAAWILVETIQGLLETTSQVTVAVPGGRSVSGIFKKLAEHDIDWPRVHLFMVDERLVPFDHPESNFRLVNEALGETVPATSLHPFVHKGNAVDEGVGDYQRELLKFGGRFDVVLVSSGEDGHIAAIFPDHFETAQRGEKFMRLEHAPKLPSRRMSATPELIAASQIGLVLFFGGGKGPALKRFFNSELTVRQCPAKLISGLPQHYILTDLEVIPL